jgi:hypothetical protein
MCIPVWILETVGLMLGFGRHNFSPDLLYKRDNVFSVITELTVELHIF